jgi:hypothetical protein
MSSLHSFYWSRLTRTFLGASNPTRLRTGDTAVKDTVSDDDCEGTGYWNWPRLQATAATAAP